MCSASKVRCNKEKPICGRCQKLGYPCFYSPARRMGRPHPTPSTSSQNNTEATEESPEQQPTMDPRGESIEPESSASSYKAPSSFEPHSPEKPTKKFLGSENEFEKAAGLAFSAPVMPPNEQTCRPQTNHYTFEKSPRKERLPDTPMFYSDDRANGANSMEVDGSYCQAMSRDNTILYPLNPSNHGSSTSSTTDSVSGVFPFADGSTSNISEYDCATVAMNMLRYLNMTSMEQLFSTTSLSDIETPPLEALMNVSSSAIKHTSTILVCACSQKVDIGLLVAAVCSAILDIYEIVLSNSNKSQDGQKEEVTVIRVLEELPRVANLVKLFTKRYSQAAEECSADTLSVLAASLKGRLKSVTSEATNRLTQI